MGVTRRAVAVFMSAIVAVPLLVSAAANDSAYQAEIEQFRQKRNESLKKNWVTLAGLFWLKPGTNSMGSRRDNDVVLPKGPARVGAFELHDKDVTLRLNSGAQATIDDKPATPTAKMALDTSGK